MDLQGAAEQATTGAQIGAGAGGQGQIAAEPAQPPGDALLQTGLGLVAGRLTAETRQHPLAERGARLIGGKHGCHGARVRCSHSSTRGSTGALSRL